MKLKSVVTVIGLFVCFAFAVNVSAQTCNIFKVDMNYMTNDTQADGQVSQLQAFLKSKGLFKDDVTGHFGTATLAAVKNFQTAQGIESTGFVGKVTRSVMNTLACTGSGAVLGEYISSPIYYSPWEPDQSIIIENVSVNTSKKYRAGQTINVKYQLKGDFKDKNIDFKLVDIDGQTINESGDIEVLRSVAFPNRAKGSVRIKLPKDLYTGTYLLNAVVNKKSLVVCLSLACENDDYTYQIYTVTEPISIRGEERLDNQYISIPEQGTFPSSVNYFFTRDLSLGSFGEDVTALQNMLIAAGYLTLPTGGPIDYRGFFGFETQTALAKWQNYHAITPANGYFGSVSRAKANQQTVVVPPAQKPDKPINNLTITLPSAGSTYQTVPIDVLAMQDLSLVKNTQPFKWRSYTITSDQTAPIQWTGYTMTEAEKQSLEVSLYEQNGKYVGKVPLVFMSGTVRWVPGLYIENYCDTRKSEICPTVLPQDRVVQKDGRYYLTVETYDGKYVGKSDVFVLQSINNIRNKVVVGNSISLGRNINIGGEVITMPSHMCSVKLEATNKFNTCTLYENGKAISIGYGVNMDAQTTEGSNYTYTCNFRLPKPETITVTLPTCRPTDL